MKLIKSFPEKLYKARTDRRMTQAQLANMTGLTQDWISHFEHGRRLPNLEIFRAICLGLKISADELLK